MKNANKSFNKEQMLDYVMGMGVTKQKQYDTLRKTDAFKKFESDFLDGKYKVISKKEA